MNSFRAFKLKLPRHNEGVEKCLIADVSPNKGGKFIPETLYLDQENIGGWRRPDKLIEEIGKLQEVKKTLWSPFLMSPSDGKTLQLSSDLNIDNSTNGSTGDGTVLKKEVENKTDDSGDKSINSEVYSCKYCSRSFSYFCHLKVHERVSFKFDKILHIFIRIKCINSNDRLFNYLFIL